MSCRIPIEAMGSPRPTSPGICSLPGTAYSHTLYRRRLRRQDRELRVLLSLFSGHEAALSDGRKSGINNESIPGSGRLELHLRSENAIAHELFAVNITPNRIRNRRSSNCEPDVT